MGTFFVLCFILCKLVLCRSEDFNLNEKEKEDVKCVVEKLYQSNKELFEKLADFIIKQGETSNDVNVDTKDEYNNSKADGEITDILSNMTDHQLINLLRSSPNKVEFTAQDLIAALHNESNGEKQASNKGNIAKAKLLPLLHMKYFNNSSTVDIQRTNNEVNETLEVDHESKNIYERQQAIPKANGTKSLDQVVKPFTNVSGKPQVLQSSQFSSQDSTEISDEKHNKLVDDLLTKLRNVCHHSIHQKSKRKKKLKRIVLTVDEDIDSAEFVKLFKKRVNRRGEGVNRDMKEDQGGENKLLAVLKQLSNSQGTRGWQMFLILNEDLDANATEGIITVDPESLSENSTVLLLGVLRQNISHNEMIKMMRTLTIELKQDSHQKVLKQLANGEIKLNTTDPFRTLIRRSYAKRFIKPEICINQYRWTKLNNTIKWIICAGNIIVPE